MNKDDLYFEFEQKYAKARTTSIMEDYYLVDRNIRTRVAHFFVWNRQDKFGLEVEYELENELFGGRGYTSMGLAMLCEVLFDKYPDAPLLHLDIIDPKAMSTPKSRSIAKRNGFVEIEDNFFCLYNPNDEIVKQKIDSLDTESDSEYSKKVSSSEESKQYSKYLKLKEKSSVEKMKK